MNMRDFWANEAAAMRDTSRVLGKEVLKPVEIGKKEEAPANILPSGRYVTTANELIIEIKSVETKTENYWYRLTNNPKIETELIFDSGRISETVKTFVVVGETEKVIIKAVKTTDAEKLAILNKSVSLLKDLIELPPPSLREHIINYLNGAYYYDSSSSRELGINPNSTPRNNLNFEVGGIIFYFNENTLGYLTARDGKSTTAESKSVHVDIFYPFLSIGIMVEKYLKFISENVRIFPNKYFRVNNEADRLMTIRGKAEKLPYVVKDEAVKFTWHSHPENGWNQPPSTDDYNFNRRFDSTDGIMFIIAKKENRVYLLNKHSSLKKTDNGQFGFFSGFMSIQNFIK
jgi:hypothetical protein